MSLSSQNCTDVHPGEMKYDLLWPIQNYPLVLLGSILELERCEQQCVQSSRFKKEFCQDICILEKIALYYPLLTLILYTVSLMLLFSSSLSYMATTLAIAGEMLPPCSSLIHDTNAIVLNIHPHTWILLTQLQQPHFNLFFALVYPLF